jgi:archaellum component FlaC
MTNKDIQPEIEALHMEIADLKKANEYISSVISLLSDKLEKQLVEDAMDDYNYVGSKDHY